MMWLGIAFLLVIGAVGEEEEVDLILLDDSNFEHLTQASSGATTGDWLVMMTKNYEKCHDCKKVEKELKKVAAVHKGLMNVAKLDASVSRLIIRRFRVPNKVSLLFFRHGMQWSYTGDMKKKKIVEFLNEGYTQQQGHRVTPPIDSIDLWKEDFIKEIKAAVKERRLPERKALLVVLGGLLAVLLLLCTFHSSKKKDERKDERKKR